MTAHGCDPKMQEAGDTEFEASQGYAANSRLALTTIVSLCLKSPGVCRVRTGHVKLSVLEVETICLADWI